jgi:hypothetical protein
MVKCQLHPVILQMVQVFKELLEQVQQLVVVTEQLELVRKSEPSQFKPGP